jgi:hypothetical protein
MHLSDVAYVVLEHLVFTNAAINGLNIDDGGTFDTPSPHVVLRDVDVRDVGTGGSTDLIYFRPVGARFVPSRNGLFVNNLVVFAVADLSAFVNVGPDTAPETFTFGNNLWYATDDPSFAGPTLTDGIPPETGSIIQMDPGPEACIGNPGSSDGRVVEGSTADFDGSCWWNPRPSIGAVQADNCTL